MILFAGGGSGGHISPGLAIAERLAEIAPDSKSIFVCSNRAIDADMLRDAGAEFIAVSATPPASPLRRPLAAARFAINFHKSKRAVMKIIRERNVTRVATLGGFVAAPVVSAANACGVPVTLVNLDTPPGKANQWMARRSAEVISAIELPSMPNFAKRVVGMPIRKRALAPGDRAYCRSKLHLNRDRNTLLITGASQGATSVNNFMIALVESSPVLFKDWQILHLTGKDADQPVRAAYERAGVEAKVEPFLNEMGLAWGAVDLAISRAGASSVSEAAHNGVPTLFLPYPYHADMHQKYNAQPLVDLGGAAMAIDRIDAAENVRQIGPILQGLLESAERRETMSARLRQHDFADAARTIAELLMEAKAESRKQKTENRREA